MKFLELIESYEEDIIRSTQESVRIKSVEEEGLPGKPFGEGPYKALEHILKLGESMGFETKNMEGYAGYIEFGQGEETIGILGHVDVVPEGSDWDYDPYGAEIVDGKIYGRGTVDDKGPTIAALYAMKALKESGVKLNKKIRMIIGANEETDWRCMDYYFKHEEAPSMAFTPDADFPVIHAEKGIKPVEFRYKLGSMGNKGVELVRISGGTAANVVPGKAEAVLKGKIDQELVDSLVSFAEDKSYKLDFNLDGEELIIKASGVSAHGSTPEKGESAIHYLMAGLGQIFDGEDDFSKFVRIYNDRIGFYHHGEKIGCGFEDDVSGKLSFNPGLIELRDGEIILTVDLRYPVKIKEDEIYKGIEENLKDTAMTFEFKDGGLDPLYVEKDHFLVKKLMEIYKEETGDMEAEPLAIGGGTYARAMENAVAFGPMFPGMVELAHQKNEYIGIDHLMKISRIYTKALYELAK